MTWSPRQREIIELVAREDLSYPKVAKRLDIHLSTVRVHVDRIVRRSGLNMRPKACLHWLYHHEVKPSADEVTTG